MRPGAHSYSNLDGSSADGHGVPWYWRMIAIAANLMILGAFLMLPATFDEDKKFRTSKAVIGIFAVALLTAGFSVTGLLCFATSNLLFHADAIFLPALISCAIGLLTIFYNFLISSRYVWNTQALLLTITAAISTIVYTGVLIWTHRKIGLSEKPHHQPPPIALTPRPDSASIMSSYQSQGYYENYVRNMFPASAHPDSMDNSNANLPGDPHSISEEEMQRQQMLMLLLQQKDQPSTPDPCASTFRIDWQGQEQDDTPIQGYYAPTANPSSGYPTTAAATPHPGIQRQWTSESLRPWDGVWRGVANRVANRPRSVEDREGRRREIEMGVR